MELDLVGFKLYPKGLYWQAARIFCSQPGFFGRLPEISGRLPDASFVVGTREPAGAHSKGLIKSLRRYKVTVKNTCSGCESVSGWVVRSDR